MQSDELSITKCSTYCIDYNIIEEIKFIRLEWTGHAQKMGENNTTKRIIENKSEGS